MGVDWNRVEMEVTIVHERCTSSLEEVEDADQVFTF